MAAHRDAPLWPSRFAREDAAPARLAEVAMAAPRRA